MERDFFMYKTQISFGITTDDLSIEPLSITEELQLNPSRMHKKGDTFIGKHTGTMGTKPRTIWAIDSEWICLEEETVSHHIEYFKFILLPKTDILKKYKEDNRFEVGFWIWIETDNAGFGLDLDENEIAFLNDFSNRVHFSLLTNMALDSQ